MIFIIIRGLWMLFETVRSDKSFLFRSLCEISRMTSATPRCIHLWFIFWYNCKIMHCFMSKILLLVWDFWFALNHCFMKVEIDEHPSWESSFHFLALWVFGASKFVTVSSLNCEIWKCLKQASFWNQDGRLERNRGLESRNLYSTQYFPLKKCR